MYLSKRWGLLQALFTKTGSEKVVFQCTAEEALKTLGVTTSTFGAGPGSAVGDNPKAVLTA